MDVTQEISAVANGRRTLSLLREVVLPRVGIAAIVVLAVALRFYGLGWDSGFPYTPHPDERAILFRVQDLSPPSLGNLGVLLDADESPWNPRWFPYGSFPLYALKGVQLIVQALPGDGMGDIRVPGRAVSALADVVTVVLVFLLGSRIYDRRTGFLASALVSLAVIHIQLSHFFAVDTVQALLAVAAVYFMYRVAREGRPRDSMLAGAFIGLGLATKVSQAPIYAAFVVAHLMYLFSLNGRGLGAGGQGSGIREENLQSPASSQQSRFEQRWPATVQALAGGIAVSVVVLFIAQPYAFLDWSRFYADITEQSEMIRRIRDYPYTRQYVDTLPYWYHMRQLAAWGFGWPLGIVAWAGLLYASLRGMRLRYGAAYLLAGWGLPVAVLLFSTSFIAIFVAAGIAVAALLATLPIRSESSRMDVLLLSWVVPHFLITGAFQVKFMRYLIPIAPFLVLFGSRMLIDLWDTASRLAPGLRPVIAASIALLVGVTGFYAVAYTNIYSETHTAVRAADWLNRNAPEGSVILKEHWEEGLPGLDGHVIHELPLYEDDGPAKAHAMAGQLAGADYLVFFSNRLYGTIPRLPERYPITAEYYRLLFTGQLGYKLRDFEATYPEFMGVSFVDDTFSRPGLPEPAPLQGFRPSPVTLDIGFADESFSVYDHPKVMVFENVARFDQDTLCGIFSTSFEVNVCESRVEVEGESSTQEMGLLLSPQEAAAQQSGGTWTDIVRYNSWTSRLPLVAWLIAIEGIGLLALPIAFMVFRPLADRGYLLSKALGLLMVSLGVWLLASLQLAPFSRGSINLVLVLVALASLVILIVRGREIMGFVRRRWSILLIGEAVFLAAFLAFVVVRMANPDLWHPFRGGEKPMDMAYLNAVLRSSYMPPYDPWFGGGYINYYYWGQFITATVVRITGIDTTIAFNLAVPLFFALTVAGAFAIVYNLTEGTRRRLVAPTPLSPPFPRGDGEATLGKGPRPPLTPPSQQEVEEPSPLPKGGLRGGASPVLAGIAAALFVAVLGNLDGAIQVGHGIERVLLLGEPFGSFDFWKSSRMMPPDPPGNEITEFPFFSFLFADLHAHMMVIPFTLLTLGLALAVVLGASRHRSGSWNAGGLVRLAFLGVAIGALRVINTWDYPTYLIVGAAAALLAEYFVQGGFGLTMFARAGVKAVFIFVAGYVAFLPFHMSYETFFSSVESTTNTTVLWQFLAISGLFIFIIGSFFVSESRDLLMGAWRSFARRFVWLVQAVSDDNVVGFSPGQTRGSAPTGGRLSCSMPGQTHGSGPTAVSAWWVLALVFGAVALGYALTAAFKGVGYSTVVFVAALLVLVAIAGVRWLASDRPDLPYLAFVGVMVGVALMLVMGLDFVRLEGDIDRMNSIFKFYLQVWVLLALSSAYLLWRLAHGKRLPFRRLPVAKKAWMGMLAALVVSAAVYPVLGTQDRLRDRFNDNITPLTLNGTAYIDGAVYHDEHGEIDLAADYEGIQWLKRNVEGSPIILEGVTPTYRWGSRVSIYTGLPTVVGWQWHQEQQRWDYRYAIGDRIRDVQRIYETTSVSEAALLLRQYNVQYIYVGQLERLYYPGPGLDKFASGMSDYIKPVFENEQVTIYRVIDWEGT